MKRTSPRAVLLCALAEMSQAGEVIDVFSVAQRTELDLYQVLKTLDELKEQQLVSGLRLTLAGLAAASGLGATFRRRRLTGVKDRHSVPLRPRARRNGEAVAAGPRSRQHRAA